MPIMEISFVPIGTSATSISGYIVSAEKALENTGVKKQITSMGTIIEAGSVEILFNLAKKMYENVMKAGSMRTLINIKIDDRLDKEASMEGKVKSVENKL